MELTDPADFARLAKIIKGFGNDTRAAILLGLYHGQTAKQLTEFLDMTRGGLQNNIYKMIDAGLLYRPSEDDEPTYKLTPMGEFFAELFHQNGDILVEAAERLDQAEKEIETELENSTFAEDLSPQQRQRVIERKKWNNLTADIEEQLIPPQLSASLVELLTEDEPVRSSTVTVLARLADQHPKAIRPAHSQLIDIITTESIADHTRANALLATTEIINGEKRLVEQTVRQLGAPAKLKNSVGTLVESHLDVVTYFARIVLATLSWQDADDIFRTVHMVSAKKHTILSLHALMYVIMTAYRDQGLIGPNELDGYRSLDISLTSIHRSKTDHAKAIMELASVIGQHQSSKAVSPGLAVSAK